MKFFVRKTVDLTQTVDMEVPPDLLDEDGGIPHYSDPKRQTFEEWVTEHVYEKASRDGNWDENTLDTDWKEDNT